MGRKKTERDGWSGARAKNCRKRLKLTRRALAARLFITERTVYEHEDKDSAGPASPELRTRWKRAIKMKEK